MISTEETIRNQIDNVEMQSEIAKTYTAGMRSWYKEEVIIDWPAVNAMIVDRWSVSGLLRIKKAAVKSVKSGR